MDNLFDVFLVLVSKYFPESFAFMLKRNIGLQFSIFVVVVVESLCDLCIWAIVNSTRQCSFSFYFAE